MDHTDLRPFQGTEHTPFLWQEGHTAALLIHGFPGTPAEMRPLATILHKAGWTVQGLLLPGFGADLPQMVQYKAEDWIDAAANALGTLRRNYDEVVLIGYSMGGAVAINAAVQEAPDQMVLIAPFWRLGNGWQDKLWPIIRLAFRSFKPFQKTNFDDPAMRSSIHNFIPGADLDNPEVRQTLRDLEVPSSVLDALHSVGTMAFRNAERIKETEMPGLIIQGTQDNVVAVTTTRLLVARLGDRFNYHEVAADHLLISAENTGFSILHHQIFDHFAIDCQAYSTEFDSADSSEG